MKDMLNQYNPALYDELNSYSAGDLDSEFGKDTVPINKNYRKNFDIKNKGKNKNKVK